MRLSFLLNWRLNPYHIPIIVAKQLGFYKNYDIDLSILEPSNPSEVTKIIGENQIPLGLKAMVHCYAARSRGYNIKSIGTLLDEPPTGLIALKEKNINSIQDIIGKKIGYVGEFGKVMIDDLAKQAGIEPNQYTTIKVGMDGADAIRQNIVDATIGIACVQQLELEYYNLDTKMLRIDEMANLGCCCFCSILFIANEDFIDKERKLLQSFLAATLDGAKLTRENPEQAFDCFSKFRISANTQLNKKIFYHMLPFVSRDLLNNQRDWQKVGGYAKRLNIVEQDYDYTQCFTNEFVPEQQAFCEAS